MSIQNYGDLKQAAIQATRRSDLTDDVINAIESVIRSLQREFFWISPTTQTLSAVAGTVFYDVPTDMVNVTYIRLLYGSNWQWMVKSTYLSILQADNNVPATRSVPTRWAPFDQQFRIYAAPDQAYTMELTGSGKIPIPATDATANFWTTNAADLVMYLALAQVYATIVKDEKSAMSYFQTAESHRVGLLKETSAKATDGVCAIHW